MQESKNPKPTPKRRRVQPPPLDTAEDLADDARRRAAAEPQRPAAVIHPTDRSAATRSRNYGGRTNRHAETPMELAIVDAKEARQQRWRRWKARQDRRVVVAPVEVDENMIAAMLDLGMISERDSEDRAKIGKAIRLYIANAFGDTGAQ